MQQDRTGLDRAATKQDILSIERPHPTLLKYYFFSALLWGPLFPILAIIGYIRYRTIRYRFDSEGITMQWGGFVRREVSLAYSRIQDIHLSSGVIERWLGLARIEIQTASAGTRAELTLEGLLQYQAVRDYLYARMRGAAAEEHPDADQHPPGHAAIMDASTVDALTHALQEAVEELRATRVLLERVREPHDGGIL